MPRHRRRTVQNLPDSTYRYELVWQNARGALRSTGFFSQALRPFIQSAELLYKRHRRAYMVLDYAAGRDRHPDDPGEEFVISFVASDEKDPLNLEGE